MFGLFESETRVQVSTSVMRVMADAAVPHSLKIGALKAIYKNENISDYQLEELVGSIAVKAEQMYAYAASHYPLGMPSGKFLVNNQGRDAVAAVIQSQQTNPTTVSYCHFGPVNALHAARMKLVNLHGYSSSTNILGTLATEKGTPVYVSNLTVVVPLSMASQFGKGTLEQWGAPAAGGYVPDGSMLTEEARLLKSSTPVVYSATATELHVVVDYQWRGPSPYIGFDILGLPNKGSFTITLTEFVIADSYYQAAYTMNGTVHYWMYKTGLGTHPTLDATFDPAYTAGTFFPFVYFRRSKTAMGGDNTAPVYLASKKMLKYLGFDYEAMIASIHTNPGIGDVEQALMMMAVPAITTNPMEQRYLFDFFENQYDSNMVKSVLNNVGGWGALSTRVQSGFVTVIQDAAFKTTLSNQGVFKKRKVGVLGKLGTYTSGYHTESFSYTRMEADMDGVVSERPYTDSVTAHTYCRQVSDVLYDELTVYGLESNYLIYQGYSTTGKDTSDNLLVPIDRAVSSLYSMTEREQLYARSLHYVFNSVQITEVEWYQQAWFGDVLMIAAIVATVMTIGQDGGAMIAAVAAGKMTLEAAVLAMLVATGKYVAYTIAARLFVKAVGMEAAIVVAVLMAAAGVYKGMDTKAMSTLPNAQVLLSLGSNISTAVSYTAGSLTSDLVDEYNVFSADNKARKAELERAEDLLNKEERQIPMLVLGESPDDFFLRTTHASNIGVSGIEALHSYVATALTLPTIQDSLGTTDYYST